MPPRGRKPTPTRIRVLTGNPQHRPMAENEPAPAAAFPTCPSWLPKDAKREWARIRRVTRDNPGWITEADSAAMVRHCVAFAMAKDAGSFVFNTGSVYKATAKNGATYIAQPPQVSQLFRALRELGLSGSELGFSPSSRTRVEIPEGGAADDDDAFFGGPRGAKPRAG